MRRVRTGCPWRDLAGMPDLLGVSSSGLLLGAGRLTRTGLPGRWRGGAPGCAMAVMPSRRNRLVPRDHDGEMYRWRHQVENFLAKTREFRAIATRDAVRQARQDRHEPCGRNSSRCRGDGRKTVVNGTKRFAPVEMIVFRLVQEAHGIFVWSARTF